MKKSLLIILAMVMVPLLTQAQDGEWTHEGNFPDDTTFIGGNMGIAVDAEGKIWMHTYYPLGSLRSDSTVAVVDVRAFHPDGTEADFSPVQQVDIDDSVSVFDGNLVGLGATGLTADADGNILFAAGTHLIRINHENGEGMNRVSPELGTTIAGPAVDDAGNIYVAGVVGAPIKMYGADMDTTEENGEIVVEAVPAIGRDLAVSGDGNTIYAPRFTVEKLYIYHRDNELVPFGEPDSALEDHDIESIGIDPHSGDVWVSAYNLLRPDSARAEMFGPNVWYGYDAETWDQVDSVAWEFDDEFEGANVLARAITFSHDANTIYVGAYRHDGENFPGVQYFTRNEPVSNETAVTELPEGYSLEQNYPNPFNPTTNINYTIKEAGNVTLKVYDVTGREVATLIESRMSAGKHTATFDASNLASGVYLYTLETNGLRLTNRMTLIK